MCGTAKPINAIGPAKAVMLPAKMLVAIIISKRVFLKLIPKLFAYFSPNNKAFRGFMQKALKSKPIKQQIARIKMFVHD